MSNEHEHSMEHGDHHVTPIWTYIKTYLWLLFLLGVTVAAYKVNIASMIGFGHASSLVNTAIAMIIAIVKTAVVALWFMHLKGSSKLTQIWAAMGVFFLLIMFLESMMDYYSRAEFHPFKF